MIGTLWTGAVRGIAVLTAALAVGVIIISIQAAKAEAGRPAAEAGLPTPNGDLVVEAQPLQPVRAATETSSDGATRQSGSSIRYPAPTDALPATRASSVSGSTSSPVRPQSRTVANRRLAAVLDLGSSAPAGTVEAAILAKQSLEAQGYDVTLAEGEAIADTGPLRPDAYVSIRADAGADIATGIEAWFCHVDSSLGGQLADLLLSSLADVGLTNVGQGDGEVGDPEAFRCDLLLAGRAQMPTVLLEVPGATAENAGASALVEGIAAGIDQFFQKYRTPLLRQDQRQGLAWPAMGAVTSHFEPGHPLGIDIGQWQGPVVSATDGLVLFADGNPCCSYGLFVVIKSANGIITLYAHLDSISVRTGQKVRQGQVLGDVGCTGYCFGTHLHFEVIRNGERLDPLSYLR